MDMESLLFSERAPSRIALGLTLDRQRLLLRIWLVATDALALALTFYLAYWSRFDLSLTVAPEVAPDPAFYLRLGAALTPLFILIFAFLRLYDVETLLGGVAEYSRVFNACSHGHMILVICTFVDTGFVVSRTWVVASWALSFTTVALGRFLTRRAVYLLRSHGFFLTPAVIVGTNREAMTLSHDLADATNSGLCLIGFVSTRASTKGDHSSTLGPVSEVRSLIERYGIEDVVVAITALSREELLNLCEDVNPCRRARLRLSSGLYELLTTGVTVETKGPVPLVGINKVRLEPNQVLAKTTCEFAVALAIVILLTPLLLLIVLAIRVNSPGPIIHRRRVLGVSGRQFDAFKFRTMYTNGAEILEQHPELKAALEAEHKLKDDPRITPVGKWLRRYSLDELPQIFNVLRGEMGLVGPRMISPEEGEKYGRHRLNLLTVRPGITGLWQVSGRSDLTYDERIRLDMLYIRNYSIWADLQILFVQTVPAVISGRGAY